jgi:hypothetical protein
MSNSQGARERCITPSAFLDLLERERLWCELLLTAMCIRAELRTVDAKSIANDLVS